MTPEARLKVGQTIRRLYREGKIVHADVSEDKNPNWKGGTKYLPYHFNFNQAARRKIRERDNYICALCGAYGKDVHHIDFDKSNPVPRLITLCKPCHGKANGQPELRPVLTEIWRQKTSAS